MILTEKKLFCLETNHTAYAFRATETGVLQHL